MKETEHYGLKKPDPEEFYDVRELNGNMDAVDAALHSLEAGKAGLGADGKVPAEQLPAMAYDPSGSAQAVQAKLDAHTGNKSNPHGVTAAQIGAAAASHTHTAAQVGAVPTGRKVNGKALTGDVTLAAGDVGAAAASHTHRKSQITDFPTTMPPSAHTHTKSQITDLVPPGYYNVAFLSGISATNTCTYFRTAEGVVSGSLYFAAASMIQSGQGIAQLPAGYRPQRYIEIGLYCQGTAHAVLGFTTSGLIQVYIHGGAIPAGTNCMSVIPAFVAAH